MSGTGLLSWSRGSSQRSGECVGVLVIHMLNSNFSPCFKWRLRSAALDGVAVSIMLQQQVVDNNVRRPPKKSGCAFDDDEDRLR
jgi:hypothetical protein